MKRKSVLLTLILVLLCSASLSACFLKNVKIQLYFWVDGEVYSVIDTNGRETIAVPSDPVKDGCVFDGWYWDEGYWQKPFTANSLLAAPIEENMSVYAKFIGENEEPSKPSNPDASDNTDTPDTSDNPSKPTANYKDKYDQSAFLGRTIDLINASRLETVSGGGRVFTDELYLNDIHKEPIGEQSSEVHTYDSLAAMIKEASASVQNKVVGSATSCDFLVNASIEVSVGSSYERKKKSETKQYGYTYSYLMNGYRLDIEGYKDIDYLRSIASQSLKNDVKKVGAGELSAQQFVMKWGTHVILSGIFGEKINVNYTTVSTNVSDEAAWRNELTSKLAVGFQKDGISNESKLNASAMRSESTATSVSTLKIEALSQKHFSVTNMSNLASEYSEWIQRSASEDYSTLIDFTENSLYCVWYLADSSDADVKKGVATLDEYMSANCSALYAQKIKAINSLMITDDVEFNSKTGELSINLASYQEAGAALDFNGSNFGGVYEVTPYYQGNPIKQITVNGAYGTRNTSGQVLRKLISPFSLKFDKDWGSTINVTLNSVGVCPSGSNGFLDVSAIADGATINLTYNGVNEIAALDGDAPAALKAKALNITSTDSAASITLRGGRGRSGGEYASGASGGSALSGDSVIVNIKGAMYAYGGDGGHGGATSSNTDRWAGKNGEYRRGGNGGHGGDAIKCVSCNITGNVTLQAGNGGNGGYGHKTERNAGIGGNGGNGGCGIRYSDTYVVSKNVTSRGGSAGAGGGSQQWNWSGNDREPGSPGSSGSDFRKG